MAGFRFDCVPDLASVTSRLAVGRSIGPGYANCFGLIPATVLLGRPWSRPEGRRLRETSVVWRALSLPFGHERRPWPVALREPSCLAKLGVRSGDLADGPDLWSQVNRVSAGLRGLVELRAGWSTVSKIFRLFLFERGTGWSVWFVGCGGGGRAVNLHLRGRSGVAALGARGGKSCCAHSWGTVPWGGRGGFAVILVIAAACCAAGRCGERGVSVVARGPTIVTLSLVDSLDGRDPRRDRFCFGCCSEMDVP